MCTNLEEGWKKLHEMGLKLKPEKCVYGRKEIEVLGWNIDETGKRPQKAKMEALQNLSTPSTFKDLQCAVGLLNYYRNQLPHYAQRAHPILKLLRGPRSDKLFKFPPDAVNAWKELISELGERNALNTPSDDGQYRITLMQAMLHWEEYWLNILKEQIWTQQKQTLPTFHKEK